LWTQCATKWRNAIKSITKYYFQRGEWGSRQRCLGKVRLAVDEGNTVVTVDIGLARLVSLILVSNVVSCSLPLGSTASLAALPAMSLIPSAPLDEAGARNGPILARCCAREHIKRAIFAAL
jgi:hypothetical protein